MSTEFSIITLRAGHGPALIFVNGFLNGSEEDFAEWLVPTAGRFPHNPCYGVRWESGTLRELGMFMTQLGAKAGAVLAQIAAMQAVKALARPVAGVGLAGCVGDLIGNPWHKAYRGARGAGKSLAQWMRRTDAEYILMGHSLGAKVVFHALESLADGATSSCRVRDVYLLGGAVSNSPRKWKNIPPLISGTLYNVFSRNDDVLRWLYRTAQPGSSPVGYAGLPLPDCPVLANVDATPWVDGHGTHKAGLHIALGGLPEGGAHERVPVADAIQEVGMAEDKLPDTAQYEKDFTEDGFWNKLKQYARTVGCEGIRNALRLYYALDNPDMPKKIKAVIYGALGYFISPLDLIPDVIPAVGYTDDIAILAAAILFAAQYIDAEVKARADEKLEQWFGKAGC